MELFVASLAALTTGIPGYLVLLAGAVIAIVRWKVHPRASALALTGLGSALLVGIAGTMANVMLQIELVEAGKTIQETTQVMAVVGMVRSVLWAASMLLVVVAIFIDRKPPAPA